MGVENHQDTKSTKNKTRLPETILGFGWLTGALP